jgi:transketolase
VLEEALALPFVCTLEDHNTETGIGSVIAGYIAESKHRPIYRRFGVTRYGASGNSKDLYNLYQLDGSGVADRIRHILKGTK